MDSCDHSCSATTCVQPARPLTASSSFLLTLEDLGGVSDAGVCHGAGGAAAALGQEPDTTTMKTRQPGNRSRASWQSGLADIRYTTQWLSGRLACQPLTACRRTRVRRAEAACSWPR